MVDKEKMRAQCDRIVESLVGKVNVEAWWASPNRAFKNQTPFVAFELDPDVVRDYLLWHAFGSFG